MLTAEMAKKKTHGGRRQGAGRPPGREQGEKLDMRISPELKQKIDENREGGEAISTAARRLLEERVSPFQSRLVKRDVALRRATRLSEIAKMLDQLGHTGPAREAAIQQLVNGKSISEAEAEELRKSGK